MKFYKFNTIKKMKHLILRTGDYTPLCVDPSTQLTSTVDNLVHPIIFKGAQSMKTEPTYDYYHSCFAYQRICLISVYGVINSV